MSTKKANNTMNDSRKYAKTKNQHLGLDCDLQHPISKLALPRLPVAR